MKKLFVWREALLVLGTFLFAGGWALGEYGDDEAVYCSWGAALLAAGLLALRGRWMSR